MIHNPMQDQAHIQTAATAFVPSVICLCLALLILAHQDTGSARVPLVLYALLAFTLSGSVMVALLENLRFLGNGPPKWSLVVLFVSGLIMKAMLFLSPALVFVNTGSAGWWLFALAVVDLTAFSVAGRVL